MPETAGSPLDPLPSLPSGATEARRRPAPSRQTKTSVAPFPSPATRAAEDDWNATTRPSSEIEGSELSSAASRPSGVAERSVVVPAATSRSQTSWTLPSLPGDWSENATRVPSAEIVIDPKIEERLDPTWRPAWSMPTTETPPVSRSRR